MSEEYAEGYQAAIQDNLKKVEVVTVIEGCKQIDAAALAWRKASWQLGLHRTIKCCGVPIIQTPEDIILLHEVIWKVQPDVLIETGTLYGGGAIFYLSVLVLVPALDATIITVDITHPPQVIQHLQRCPQIHPVTGDSTSQKTVDAVREIAFKDKRDPKVLVILDSNHTKAHVLKELAIYSELVTISSYLVVLDTGFEDLHDAPGGKEEWRDDNPAAAVREFLLEHKEFEADVHFDRFKVGYANGGFLRRTGQRNEQAV